MNIRSSMNVYFLVSMIIFGVSIAFVFSFFSLKFFEEGRDRGISNLMIEVARQTDLSQQPSVEVLGFTVARSWIELPEEVRQNIEEPTRPFRIRKVRVGSDSNGIPRAIHMVQLVVAKDGESMYVSRTLSRPTFELRAAELRRNPLDWIVPLGIIAAAAFSLLLLLTLRTVVKPLEELQLWAKSLTADNLGEPAPSFNYKEFRSLAEIIRGSLTSVQHSLEKEQEFLRHASHELRSPLTVMQGNIDLLKRIESNPESKESEIVSRMARAVTTMNQLVQTLLWLSRDDRPTLAQEKIALDELTREVVDELSYLKGGKDIEVKVDTTPIMIEGSKSACRIVIANLIRNAFQHTQSGMVSILQRGAFIEVRNRNVDGSNDRSNDLGFGLGAMLTEKLARQFAWDFETRREPGEFVATLDFSISE